MCFSVNELGGCIARVSTRDPCAYKCPGSSRTSTETSEQRSSGVSGLLWRRGESRGAKGRGGGCDGWKERKIQEIAHLVKWLLKLQGSTRYVLLLYSPLPSRYPVRNSLCLFRARTMWDDRKESSIIESDAIKPLLPENISRKLKVLFIPAIFVERYRSWDRD